MEIEKNENKGGVEALTDTIVEAMQDLKAQAVTVIDMEKLDSAPASRFVICEGKSTTQTGSIADNVRDMTTVGGLVKHFVNNVLDEDDRRHKKGHRK